MERVFNYKHKAEVLRQIHSDRAKRYNCINSIQSIITVVVSGFITFIGFYGTEKLRILLNLSQEQESLFEFIFNFFIFLLFVNVILHLVFHFSKKQADANRAIVLLSSFMNETSDIIENIKHGRINSEHLMTDVVRYKYDTIIQSIPANRDKEFLKAKKSLQNKENANIKVSKINSEIFDETFLEEHLINLIMKSPLYELIKEVREVNADLYLGGGAVRNLVWDELHNYSLYTQIADLDIIYFDSLSNTKEHDKRLEGLLFKKIPNIKWSVKNQARMHLWNKEEAYSSLEEAIEKWPETCTAIAVRIGSENNIEVVKPFGLTDLYRLIVTPTPHFKNQNKLERYRERINSKNWEKTWKKLRITDI